MNLKELFAVDYVLLCKLSFMVIAVAAMILFDVPPGN